VIEDAPDMKSTCSASILRSGLFGDFQFRFRSGERDDKSFCIKGKTPYGSWYSTVTFELEELSIALHALAVVTGV